jgi:two-component system nitrate/nitrite response regulator NarL
VAALRLLLVADDPLVRAGLAALLSEAETCDVVGQSSAGDELSRAQELFDPDVVLWDLGWEPMNDFALLADFAESAVPLLVLLDDVNLVAGAWAAGARGILQRQIDLEQLEAALAATWQGLAVLSPDLGARLGGAALPAALLVEELTAREMDVLQLMAEGAANKEIARSLGISENTVKYHVNAILGKLDAQSRTEAVVRATRAGLILL